MSQHHLPLPGCAPIPLAHYLKALGILRLVAEDHEHGDPTAAGCWERDVFILHSRLDRDGLLDFFLHHYQPTPILAPWNKGGGFFDGASASAVKQIRNLEGSQADRLRNLRQGCSEARKVINALGLTEVPEGDSKDRFIQSLRGAIGDANVAWLDAAYALTASGAMPPPLLGKGATDGRFEFTNNFIQCLGEVMSFETGTPADAACTLLQSTLWAAPARLPLAEVPAGQFLPGLAGGANAGPGFQAESQLNPWDFVLMIEGTLLFATAAVRRLEFGEPGSAAFPFFVRQAGAGYGTASRTDELTPTPKEPIGSRGEMWLPLWSRPTGLSEIRTLFSEGRAQIGKRAARTGLDFARAVVSLGVDRGLRAFERIGFQVRNGRSVFATPLGRFRVHRNARADLLNDVDRWLNDFRRAAAAKRNPDGKTKEAPASVSRALNHVENRILDLCKHGEPARLLAVLTALGQAESSLARSLRWAVGKDLSPQRERIAPLSGLSPRWLREADDGSIEFRLAAALASVSGSYKGNEGRSAALPLRQHLEPVAIRSGNDRHWFAWDDPPSNDVLWHEGDLVGVLNAIFARRLVRAGQAGKSELPDIAQCFARLDDVVAFLEGRTDDDLLADLLWGLSLVDWSADIPVRPTPPASEDADRNVRAPDVPSALFSLLRLAFPRPGERGDSPEVPAIPMIHRHAAAGNGLEASRLALRRLRGSSLHPALSEVAITGEAARRAAAALLFPLSRRDFARLGELVLKPQTENQTNP